MTFSASRRLPRTIAAAALVFGLSISALSADDAAPPAGALTGRVIADGKPAAGARVRLYVDDVEAKPRAYKELKSVEIGDAGTYEFSGLKKGWYLLVAARDGSARTFHYVVMEEEAKLSNDFVLHRPVSPVIIVRDETGKPVAGARLRTLGPRDENGEFWIRNRKEWETFSTTPAPSDEAGRLTVPGLPEGAVFETTIDHPDLAPAEVKDVTAKSGVMAEAVLKPGVAVALKVATDKSGRRPPEAEIDLRHDPFSSPSSIFFHRLPLDAEGIARLTVEPGRYSYLRLKHEDYHLTPVYSPRVTKGEYLRLGASAHHEFHFVPHRKVKVRGRVIDVSTGRPLAKGSMMAEIPNVGPDGDVPDGGDAWAHADWGEIDEKGEYVVELAAGKARVSFQSADYVPEERFTEFEVAADGSTAAPDIRVRPMPKIAGRVLDAQGQPFAGAVVRLRGDLRHMAPARTDAEGKFELSPPWVPLDWETEESKPVQPLVAFDPYRRLMARSDVKLDDPESLKDVTLTLAPHAPGALIEEFHDELAPIERGEVPPDRAAEMAAATLKGRPAPELDGTWLNIEKPSAGLAAFRGKYVLLDFWFIGCGPCHADFPSVKLLHELYKDRGLVVIAVHNNSSTAEAVRAYAEKEGMTPPILVDEPDGRTAARYEDHGLSGYPSHILIGPDGTVIDDDRTTPGPSLRSYKLELIRELLLDREAGE